MRLAIISFTARGSSLGAALEKKLTAEGESCKLYVQGKYLSQDQNPDGVIPLTTSLTEWTKEQFETKDGIIFIGAAGIAVRAIAPYIKSKTEDPAVVVMDDGGNYAVSLLSGHLGGANDLAIKTGQLAGAVPVITTATDIHKTFAVDVFAKKHKMAISDMKKAKAVSADLLDGKMVGFRSDFPVEGPLYEGLYNRTDCEHSIWITIKDGQEKDLRLIPRILVLGIGCRRDTPISVVEDAVNQVLKESHLSPESVAAVATIDIKKEEKALAACAKLFDAEFVTYTAEELQEVEGDFTPSSFVKEITGVDNVCERAAMAWAGQQGGGHLLVKKQAANGVTVAAAVREWKVKL